MSDIDGYHEHIAHLQNERRASQLRLDDLRRIVDDLYQEIRALTPFDDSYRFVSQEINRIENLIEAEEGYLLKLRRMLEGV